MLPSAHRYSKDGHVVQREATTVGAHVSAIGNSADISLGLSSGTDRSDVVVSKEGDLNVSRSWTEAYSGRLTLSAKIGKKGDSWSLVPAFSSKRTDLVVRERADGEPLRTSGGLVSSLSFAQVVAGSADRSVINRVAGVAAQSSGWGGGDGFVEQVYRDVNERSIEKAGFGIARRTEISRTTEEGTQTTMTSAVHPVERVGNEVHASVTRKKVNSILHFCYHGINCAYRQ